MKHVLILALMVPLLMAGCDSLGGRRSNAPVVTEPLPAPAPVAKDARSRAQSHTELGLAYLQDSRLSVALDEARKALGFDSRYAPAHNLKALVHMAVGEPGMAREHFQEALRLAPDDPEINNNFGWFLCKNGAPRDGIERLVVAARNPYNPAPARPFTNAALCALMLQDVNQAERHLQYALVHNPGSVQALFLMADVQYRKGDYRQARQSIGEVMAKDEPNAESLWLATRIERRLGNRQSEAGYASQLRRRFAGTPEFEALTSGKYD